MPLQSPKRAFRCLITALPLAALGACSDGTDFRACPAEPRPATTVALDTHDYGSDPDTSVLDGTLVLLEEHENGQPRQIGLAVDPGPDTAWTIEGREVIWFMDGSLTRQLMSHLGEEARIHGVVRAGHSFLRAIALRAYELPTGVTTLPRAGTIVADAAVEGEVVVVARHANGHPAMLGIDRGQCGIAALADTAKSRELVYRIGRTVSAVGALNDDGEFTVVSYRMLEGNPLVAPGDGFRLSFLAGGIDAQGNFMGGVEVDALAAFDGRIFAGTSYSQNTQQESPDPAPPGSQILVLDAPDGRWRVDYTAPDANPGTRSKMKALDIVRFDTDYAGTILNEPLELLAAASGNGEVYLREPGEPARWHATGVAQVVRAASEPGRRQDARSLVGHRDTVTGISHLFAGVGIGRRPGAGGGIYRGAYDPAMPGLIRWHPEAELPIADGPRPMGLSVVADTVYAAVGPRLFRRIDGPQPQWKEVLFYPNPFRPDSVRRATALRRADGGQSLLVGIENLAGAVLRIDPDNDHAAEEELLFNEAFPGSSYTIVAYNGPRVRQLDNGSEIALLGLEMNRVRTQLQPPPEPFDFGGHYEFTDGLFLVRSADGSYRLNRVRDHTLEVHPPLVAPRTVLTQSPFEGEENVIYFGGFDHNGNLSHNSGWIFKAHLEDVLKGGIALPTGAGP